MNFHLSWVPRKLSASATAVVVDVPVGSPACRQIPTLCSKSCSNAAGCRREFVVYVVFVSEG